MNKNSLKALVRPLLKNVVSLRLLAEKKIGKRKRLADYDPSLEKDLDIVVHPAALPAIPKQIWMFWAGSTLPSEIQAFVKKIARENPEYKLTVVNSVNLQQFLPGLQFTRSDMLVAHKSDYIRLELLYRYGGIWMDATTILNCSLDNFLSVNLNSRYDMVAFYRDVSTVDKNYPIIETWFMAAPPGNDFIKRWLHYFSPIMELGAVEYFRQLKSRPDYEQVVQRITDPGYLILNIAQQLALREYNQYNFYLRKCEANAFYYQRLVSWNAIQLSRMMMVDSVPETLPPLIKLTGLERKFLATNLKYGVVNKDSLIGGVIFADQKQTLPNLPISGGMPDNAAGSF
ncbi:glycosyltransferase family 32 protein [Pantoea sp. BAV 3049]|uniref:glycosyltransferase family 32 protein n=1 Tax=Pantoea sp. BAV 3049 TaxID=2654188 RepID=UPI00131DEA36|nr:capsular polysaccharide synthesis protein [Pantoea sp. BAV 3049]